ncbi:MAG: serine/threonine protein kinase, partial [Deltaproteobacteria bacterium]|nr:serine/threonine protein kinase [Deltaproteobacteria bacterium]
MSQDPSLQDTITDARATSAPDVSQDGRLGRFLVIRKLGEGAMGTVFTAYDEELDRRVAIKVLNRDSRDEDTRARLLREAQALAKLSHPNVVQVYEVGQSAGAVFIAMEFVAGQTLRTWMDAGPRPWAQTLAKFAEAGRGLAAAHDAGLIHRDFKPDNAIVGEDDRVRVLDFGLARADGSGTPVLDELDNPLRLDDTGPETALRSGSEQSARLSSTLTRTGARMGTPAYMAPEQYQAGTSDARTDQFSFCVALWEAVYGERPFRGGSLAALGYAVLNGNIEPPPRGTAVPGWLHAVLLRGLSTRPEDRHPDMQSLLRELSRDRARRWRVAGLGL